MRFQATEPRVEVAEGTAFEVLLDAAAVADANWREVFSAGPAVYADVSARLGSPFVRRVGAFGRFGWINLVGLLVRAAQPWDLDRLVAAAGACDPEELHFIAVGGDRRQLRAVVEEPVIRAGVAGDAGARSLLTAAFSADTHVLECTRWLLDSPSVDVHHAIVDILQTWRSDLLPPAAEATAAATLHGHALAAQDRLTGSTSRAFLDETIGGLHYDPAGLDRVLAVSSPRATPVIVVVDGCRETVILHPPLDREPSDSASRLLELGRAVGDRNRMRVLTALRSGELTAVDLAGALGAPRTTLLHHLAILRSAGLIHTTVTPGGATLYRLRPEGLRELSASASGFIPTE